MICGCECNIICVGDIYTIGENTIRWMESNWFFAFGQQILIHMHKKSFENSAAGIFSLNFD